MESRCPTPPPCLKMQFLCYFWPTEKFNEDRCPLRMRAAKSLSMACFGFMEQPDIPGLLPTLAEERGLDLASESLHILVHETFQPDDGRGMPVWAKYVHRWLEQGAERVSESCRLPADRVREVHPPGARYSVTNTVVVSELLAQPGEAVSDFLVTES